MLARRVAAAARAPPSLRRALSVAAANPDGCFESRSRRAQQLFTVRRADERAQDGMEVWGMQNRKRRRAAAPQQQLREEGAPVPPKRPSDSLLTLMLPFRSDPKLRELYLNAAGHLRIGRLLEDFDSFAGQIAYTHCDDPGDPKAEPITLVTASLDRIDLVKPIPTDKDLMLRGCVTWVGRSSMAIAVTLSGLPGDLDAKDAMRVAAGQPPSVPVPPETAEALRSAAHVGRADVAPIVRADFTFVARDADDKAVAVPPVVPESPQEKALHTAAADARVTRSAEKLTTLDKSPPTPDELGLVHRLFADLRALTAAGKGPRPPPTRHLGSVAPPLDEPQDGVLPPVYVASTAIESTVVTFPTDRNIHGKVFGGWLLRNAFELAWTAALRFGGSTPEFVAMSDIAFLRPVEIGAVLSFRAAVEFAKGAPHRTASVRVETTSLDPRNPRAAQPTTNTFHFTFEFPAACAAGAHVARAFPQTYEEAMAWVAAHRRQQAGLRLRSKWAMEGGEPLRV